MVLPDLFGDVVDPSVKVGDRGFRSLPVSVLPRSRCRRLRPPGAVQRRSASTPPAVMAFVAPMVPPTPPPPAPPRAAVAAARVAAPAPNPAAAPIEAPAEIRRRRPGAARVRRAGWRGRRDSRRHRRRGHCRAAEAPPAPAPPPPEAPIRIGGNIRPPTKIRDVAPVWTRSWPFRPGCKVS
ncbi:MAG: hypothetical protein MZV63_16735 [Marinilabiliales bacterium]|nr:hypothetical protein [Marinilabiliales bacterium]